MIPLDVVGEWSRPMHHFDFLCNDDLIHKNWRYNFWLKQAWTCVMKWFKYSKLITVKVRSNICNIWVIKYHLIDLPTQLIPSPRYPVMQWHPICPISMVQVALLWHSCTCSSHVIIPPGWQVHCWWQSTPGTVSLTCRK